MKLLQFHLTELHYRIVIPCVQVRLESTYGHGLVYRLHFYIFRVVLAIFL